MEHYTGDYKHMPAHILRDRDLEILVTDYGAKIQSILFLGKQMLYQSSSKSQQYRRSAYASHFEEGEFSGFDHLFPNISATPYPDYPWQGIAMPDHGEVWSQDWIPCWDGTVLRLTVSGIQMPYNFTVEMALKENTLHLRYEAENLSGYPMKYLWCCHPLFILEDGMTLELPECRRIINISPGQKYLGGFLQEHAWPVCQQGRDMSKLSSQERCCNKYYVWNPRQKNEAVLHYPDGMRICVASQDDSVPYMGVWVDELGHGQYAMKCIAPELASAALDSYAQADKTGTHSILKPGEKRHWTMTVSFALE